MEREQVHHHGQLSVPPGCHKHYQYKQQLSSLKVILLHIQHLFDVYYVQCLYFALCLSLISAAVVKFCGLGRVYCVSQDKACHQRKSGKELKKNQDIDIDAESMEEQCSLVCSP